MPRLPAGCADNVIRLLERQLLQMTVHVRVPGWPRVLQIQSLRSVRRGLDSFELFNCSRGRVVTLVDLEQGSVFTKLTVTLSNLL